MRQDRDLADDIAGTQFSNRGARPAYLGCSLEHHVNAVAGPTLLRECRTRRKRVTASERGDLVEAAIRACREERNGTEDRPLLLRRFHFSILFPAATMTQARRAIRRCREPG